VLEHNGKPVAAIVPMGEYRKWHPVEDENAFDYELPEDLLKAYHELQDRKFSTGLTPEEEVKLAQLDKELDDLDDTEAAQPLIQSMQNRALAQEENWEKRFKDAIAKLRELKEVM